MKELRRTNGQESTYRVAPKTAQAKAFFCRETTDRPHNTVKDPQNQDIDFYVANIEGLLTNNRNKCEQNLMMCLPYIV